MDAGLQGSRDQGRSRVGSQKITDFSSLVSKVTPSTSVVVLPGRSHRNAQQFGRNLASSQGRLSSSATDGLFSPARSRSTARMCPRSPGHHRHSRRRLDSPPPRGEVRILRHVRPARIRGDGVIDQAIATVCKSGQTPKCSNVLAAIKNTNEPATILGQPIQFASNGDLITARFFLFKINAKGQYKLIQG